MERIENIPKLKDDVGAQKDSILPQEVSLRFFEEKQ